MKEIWRSTGLEVSALCDLRSAAGALDRKGESRRG